MKREFIIKVILTVIGIHIGLFSLLGCGNEDKDGGQINTIWVKNDIILPSLLSDNAILQQNSRVLLWGKTDPLVSIKIYTSWDDKEVTTVSDDAGNFAEQVQTPAAGGPFHITFNAGKEKRLKNIMVGEVWFCSGQSNMGKTMAGSPFDKLFHSGPRCSGKCNMN